MKNSLFQRAAQFYKEQRRKKLWHRVVSGMACVVVFGLLLRQHEHRRIEIRL